MMRSCYFFVNLSVVECQESTIRKQQDISKNNSKYKPPIESFSFTFVYISTIQDHNVVSII